MMNGFGGYSWGMGFGWLLGIIILGICIWLFTKMINQANKTNPFEHKSALDILKERYARGEISKEELKEKRRHVL